MDNSLITNVKKTKIQPDKKLIGLGKSQKNTAESFKEVPVRAPEFFPDLRKIIISKYKGDVVTRYDCNLRYKYFFNYKTGEAIRSNYFTEAFEYTNTDVFAANFPHMVDIGIMGHCSHGRSGLCLKSGVQCYQNGLSVEKPNMSLENFKRIAAECKDLTNQFALGGRGDPNEHENFEEILKTCRENHIVPNYTTSGFDLTDEQILISKKYCGAVAVSWYRSDYTYKAIQRFIDAGVKTNIHYVLNHDTLDEAIHLFETDSFPQGVNAVIFLTHKPVGLGQKEKCLRYNDPKVHRMFKLIKQGSRRFKVGIDGCLVVGLINSGLRFDMRYLDTCEATRFTCYIDADMNMFPCSFDINGQYGVSLRENTIAQAWNSEQFQQFRNILREGCKGCEKSLYCYGGCVLHKSIVLCPSLQEGVCSEQ